jgi:hypothetical protein
MLQCKHCDYVNDKDAKYCIICGKSTKWSKNVSFPSFILQFPNLEIKTVFKNFVNFLKSNFKYCITIILIMIFLFIGYLFYVKIFYHKIITVKNDIWMKKEPHIIEYFNNDNIWIFPKNTEHIISQFLVWYRKFSYPESSYSSYKFAWYQSYYNLNSTPLQVQTSTKNEVEQKQITLDSEIINNHTIISYNENNKLINLYKTNLFNDLNHYVNKKTFYAIWKKWHILDTSIFENKIFNLLDLSELFEKINIFCNNLDVDQNFIILTIDNNKLYLKIIYKLNSDFDGYKNLRSNIEWVLSNQPEYSKLVFSDTDISLFSNVIEIDTSFHIDTQDLFSNETVNNLKFKIMNFYE